MKLIFCEECHDIVKLTRKLRACECGRSQGQYSGDGLHAIISGPCIPLGISGSSFVQALRLRPAKGLGERFDAFVIAKKCDTILTIRRQA